MARKRQTEKHKKELKRVRQFIARAEKRGYEFPDTLKSELYGYSTQKLKGLKPGKLYGMARYVDRETGEIFSGMERRKQESLPGRIKAQTDAHEREYRRVRDFIRRAEGRGYRFSDELKWGLYGSSTQKLKGLTPKKLYEQATAVDEETGEILTGTQRRAQERSLSAKLGAFTRKIRDAVKRGKEAPKPLEEPKPGLRGKLGGVLDKIRGFFGRKGKPMPAPAPEPPSPPVPPPAPEPGPYDGLPDESDIIIDNVLEQLTGGPDKYGTSQQGRSYRRSNAAMGASESAKDFLRRCLEDAIARDGKATVASRIASNANAVSMGIDMVRYSSDGAAIYAAMAEVATIFNGGSLTLSQMMEIGDIQDAEEDWEPPE